MKIEAIPLSQLVCRAVNGEFHCTLENQAKFFPGVSVVSFRTTPWGYSGKPGIHFLVWSLSNENFYTQFRSGKRCPRSFFLAYDNIPVVGFAE
jgi:hypothetical protein